MLKVCTYNVCGLGDNDKRQKIFRFLNQMHYNIIFMQETHSSKNNEKFWRTQWGGRAFFSHGNSASRGTAILIKKEVKCNIKQAQMDDRGRFVIVQIEHNDRLINLIAINGPNEDSPSFFQEVFLEVASFEDKFMGDTRIIGGDFNLALDLDIDKQGGKYTTHKKSVETLKAWLADQNIIDVFRLYHGDKMVYTWKRQDIKVRLDYIFIDQGTAKFTTRAEISHGYKSDHAIPWIAVKSSNLERGPGLWRANISLLKEEVLKTEIIRKIEECKTVKLDILDKWELLKYEVKQVIRKYAKMKNESRQNKLQVLIRKIENKEKEILHIEEGLASIFTKQQCLEAIDLLQKEKEDILQYRLEGSKIRARAKWYQSGDKNSSYFLNLEKRNYVKKNRFVLKDNEGSLITDNREILTEQDSFFKDLFESKHSDQEINNNFFDFIQGVNLPKLTEQEANTFEEDINMSEIYAAVVNLKKDKVPGNDGLPIEFYQIYWAHLRGILFHVINVMAKHGLKGSSAQVVITLLDKGKDNTRLENWRPISLINCHTKILSKIVTARLENVIQRLIHPDQTGFIRNRLIHENILDLLSIIDLAEDRNEPYMIVGFDFRKADDTLEHQYIDLVLKEFGFKQRFREIIRNLHKKTEFCTINCGYTSKYSPISRGLRQGNPASCLIFNLAVEPVAQKIRQDPQIEGIQIKDRVKKLSQYADDLWTCTKANQKSFDALLKIFKKFEDVAGLGVNYDKTEILRIGSIRKSDAKLYSQLPIQWSTHIKILGIHITADRTEMVDMNYSKIIEKMRKTLAPWCMRSLTLIGKVLVCNSLVISQAIYNILAISLPSEKRLKEIKKIINEFLWEGKPARIAHRTLNKEYVSGGLKLVDIYAKMIAIKSKWVQKILKNNTKHVWLDIAQILLGISPKYLFESNLDIKDIENKKHGLSWIS